MDFELLNFWISKLRLHVKHTHTHNDPCLYLYLKAHDNDFLYSYCILLSTKKNAILEFFGFDTSVNYDELTEKNLFQFLSTSTKLHPSFIQYCGFKGPHPKNKLHGKYNEYLKTEYFSIHNNDTNCQHAVELYARKAISFFGRENKIKEYMDKKALFNAVMAKRDLLEEQYKDDISKFSSFVSVYGIINVSEMDANLLIQAWKAFLDQNWTGLASIGC